MSPAPVSPESARAQAAKKYQRHFGHWAVAVATTVDPGDPALAPPTLELPLHPPTEAQALRQGQAAIDWVRSWKGVAGAVWGERQWASLGRQRVPERLSLKSPADVAHFCGKATHWRRVTARFMRLAALAQTGTEELFATSLARSAAAVESLADADFERLLGVLGWLGQHPRSGRYVRQLPIRGVDSKWVGTHRSLVERLHAAVTGAADLGLAAAPSLVRVRFLDPRLAPGGLSDVAAPVDQLAGLGIAPRTVFVFENLESVLAMPPMPGSVVVHGSGYAVDRLVGIPWIRTAHVIYWGDLDSHGFAILNRFRSQGLAIETALMDTATLDAYADLCVPEPKPATGVFTHLHAAELQVLTELAIRGNVRLEQERIDWHFALLQLAAARQSQTKDTLNPQ